MVVDQRVGATGVGACFGTADAVTAVDVTAAARVERRRRCERATRTHSRRPSDRTTRT